MSIRHRGTYCYLCAAALFVLFYGTASNCAATSQARLFWTTSGHLGTNGISSAQVDGSDTTKLVDSPYPFDIDVLPQLDVMYWTDAYGSIGRSGLDGSDAETILSDLTFPVGIAVDVLTQSLYWSDNKEGIIRRADLDGSNTQEVITGLSLPREIEIDPIEQKLYWVENGLGQIKRSNLDGSVVELLVDGLSANSYGVHGIDLDLTNRMMYWAEDGSDKIGRAELDGSNAETIITAPGAQPVSVSVDPLNGHIYWSDYTPGKIHRANLDGTGDIVLFDAYHPIGIAFIPEPATWFILSSGALVLSRRRR